MEGISEDRGKTTKTGEKMTRHIGIAEHMQLASTIQWTVLGFAIGVVSLVVVCAVLAERWDDDGNY